MLRGKMYNDRVAYYLINTYKDENGCMIWLGGTSQGNHGKSDYAVAEIDGEKFYVHRYIAFSTYSDEERRKLWDDKEVQVMHTCDVKLCINPEHLEVGNQSLNMQDAITKGIKVMPKGQDHPRAILTEADVRDIRDESARGGRSQRAMARDYGVSQATIWQVIHLGNWRHI